MMLLNWKEQTGDTSSSRVTIKFLCCKKNILTMTVPAVRFHLHKATGNANTAETKSGSVTAWGQEGWVEWKKTVWQNKACSVQGAFVDCDPASTFVQISVRRFGKCRPHPQVQTQVKNEQKLFMMCWVVCESSLQLLPMKELLLFTAEKIQPPCPKYVFQSLNQQLAKPPAPWAADCVLKAVSDQVRRLEVLGLQ